MNAAERESIVCLRMLLANRRLDPALEWLQRCSAEPFRHLFQVALGQPIEPPARALAEAFEKTNGEEIFSGTFDSSQSVTPKTIIEFYERFLAKTNGRLRGSRGVYYTPRAITSFIVREVHTSLKKDFGLPQGIADLSFVRILDPAAGTGAFLVEAIDCIHSTFLSHARERDTGQHGSNDAVDDAWNAFVADSLLPRLHGWELMLPAATLAHLAIAEKLRETRFRFETKVSLQIECRDSLTRPPCDTPTFNVVIGNPPYSTLSTNDDRWITNLLHGDDDGEPTADYFEVAGQPLGERKVWLHDDYVKFLRLGQRLLDRTASGILGFVTNHGFLDNITFRGVRYQLMQAFPEIDVVDLHGNRKSHERAPDGGRDENVFGIDQGVAIALFRKRPDATPQIGRADVWGSREWKERTLAVQSIEDLTSEKFLPQPPRYIFDPNSDEPPQEYASGWKLTELMPTHTTAPVTARDSFVIAFNEEELLARLEEFADLSLSDSAIREKYFGRTRSSRYQAGDTRSWKLSEARRRMSLASDLRGFVRDCWYRPFDRRKIVWVDWMIDWPRSDVMSCFDRDEGEPSNIALVARRQMLSSQPCNFFWVVDDLAIDGLIRSDNRGSESLFPLWRDRSDYEANAIAEGLHRFDSPTQLLRYTYALFHWSSYRERYASWLRTDFPRVVPPRNDAQLNWFAEIGSRLIDLHLLRDATIAPLPWQGSGDIYVAKGFPKYDDGNIYVNAERWISGVSEDVWKYRIGAHQVCRKWLKDRRGRTLNQHEQTTYAKIPNILARTLELIDHLDAPGQTIRD